MTRKHLNSCFQMGIGRGKVIRYEDDPDEAVTVHGPATVSSEGGNRTPELSHSPVYLASSSDDDSCNPIYKLTPVGSPVKDPNQSDCSVNCSQEIKHVFSKLSRIVDEGSTLSSEYLKQIPAEDLPASLTGDQFLVNSVQRLKILSVIFEDDKFRNAQFGLYIENLLPLFYTLPGSLPSKPSSIASNTLPGSDINISMTGSFRNTDPGSDESRTIPQKESKHPARRSAVSTAQEHRDAMKNLSNLILKEFEDTSLINFTRLQDYVIWCGVLAEEHLHSKQIYRTLQSRLGGVKTNDSRLNMLLIKLLENEQYIAFVEYGNCVLLAYVEEIARIRASNSATSTSRVDLEHC